MVQAGLWGCGPHLRSPLHRCPLRGAVLTYPMLQITLVMLGA